MNEPIQVSLADMNTVIKFPPITDLMRRFPRLSRKHRVPFGVGYSEDALTVYLDRDLQHLQWIYLGRAIDIDRFLIMRALVEKSIIDFIEQGDPRDVQRLMISLRMTERTDRLYDHAHAVATTAELYTVRLQHGGSGVKSYLEFLDRCAKDPAELDSADLPSELDTHFLGGTHAD